MPIKLIPPHGGYRKLLSYQTSEIVYDFTAKFCDKYVTRGSNGGYTRTHDQMVQAARSGKQNIAEGCQASGTSKKTELKLVNVAKASLEELLLDYEDFLRQRGFVKWQKDDPRAKKIRDLAYMSNKSYATYAGFLDNPESAANCAISLIHQANFLLDRQLKTLENDFLKNGGFSENLTKARNESRKNDIMKNWFNKMGE